MAGGREEASTPETEYAPVLLLKNVRDRAGSAQLPNLIRKVNMIERYSDHAANERTFLAWVRTAIAIMAFGFLVEKFDLFLEIASASLSARDLSVGGRLLGNVAGLLLILLGAVTMVLAIVRFRKTAIDIDSAEQLPGAGERLDITLAGLLVLLGVTLFVYLSYTLIGRL